MGAASSQGCFPTAEQAAATVCARTGGVASAGAVSCTGVTSTTETGAVLQLAFTGPEATVTAAQALTFGTCEPLTGAEGAELGWMVGAVFIGVAVIRLIARGAK